MNLSLHNVQLTNFTINILAIIMGILWWSFLSELHRAQRTVTIPLCFYKGGNYTITAPEQVTITLSGKKSQLRTLDSTTLAAHIDATSLPEQSSVLMLTEKHLLLPQTINLLSYSPSNLVVTLRKK
jgi:hypothetical protein